MRRGNIQQLELVLEPNRQWDRLPVPIRQDIQQLLSQLVLGVVDAEVKTERSAKDERETHREPS